MPTDVDAAIQAEADRRGTSWADELRRAYVTVATATGSDHASARAIAAQAMASGEASSVDPKPEPSPARHSFFGPTKITGLTRCRCAKPVMSKTVTNVCTVCHLIR